ncbi:PREDICTED: uncharacterized protein LOC109464908 [Branchiostoma belcheri]|uniref:Uncharacterized protein LOC109464908 n=1 Tax=Branchiostoma belcheri TaxID=7741 RepID=A0A6P4XLT0_BRABE|nr:PREDICTED: uncharacterized protein LOC109464908 [Branchiostoma belcheri]
MPDNNMTSLASKLGHLQLCLKSEHDQELGYGLALREAIITSDHIMEIEVLKSLGDLHLEKAKLRKDSAEFDKAAGLYAAALLRCKDPNVGETLEHRVHYMEKLSRQLLQGYSPQYQSPDFWGTADSNVLRVTEICDKLVRSVTSWRSLEEVLVKTLVNAIASIDIFLELEVLKSLGDLYLEKGKKTSDVSQFSKAAAMYNKALTTCEEQGAKETLHHRIRYTDKIRDAVKKVNLDSAEKYFAAALKTVHLRDPTVQQYQREVEPLCKLGDVYSKRGQQTGDGGDLVKAAALYNAAIARSEDQVLNGNLTTAIREIEKLFLQCILDVHCVAQNNTENHKKQLKEMRDQIKLEMETIDQQLDPYVHDEDDPCVRKIEAKRAQAVRQLFKKIAQQRKEFISLLVEECIGLMGPPPCKYALIGLGSQATGLVTPYSDLEFAILVEKESEECLVYFRKLTHYLHLKVVNLGETILPALAIRSLNDFYSINPLDNWYYDSVTPRGFAFDGSMPKASKTPLGRQGTKNRPPSELICTPQNMVKILQNDATLYQKEGYHLASILRNPCLIAGDQDLVDIYMNITVEILQADGGKMAHELAQMVLKENIKDFSDNYIVTAEMIDVKKKLYRFPAVAVDCLALLSGIIPTTVWKTIDKMENQPVICPHNANHVRVLVSISAELRLRTYIANGGQRENLSGLSSMQSVLQETESYSEKDVENSANTLKPVFHLPTKKQLIRYYYTAIPLKKFLSEQLQKKHVPTLMSHFYVESPVARGMMYFELCEFAQAVIHLDEALKRTVGTGKEKMSLCGILGRCWLRLGDYQKARRYLEEVEQIQRSMYGPNAINDDIASCFLNLGLIWQYLADQKTSIAYLEKALKMYKSIHGQENAHLEIAHSLKSLGDTWFEMGNYRKAIEYVETAIQMFRSIHGQLAQHHHIATALGSLGLFWSCLGNHGKAITYTEQAQQMYFSIYGQNAVHPEIAGSFNNLGKFWLTLGDNKKALSYLEKAIQMSRSIYGQKAHLEIVTTLCSASLILLVMGDHKKAMHYCEEALQMKSIIYGQSKPAEMATLLTNMGILCHQLGKYQIAISQLEEALQIHRSVLGQTAIHPSISKVLINMEITWRSLGDLEKSVSYCKQALTMLRNIHGQTKEHQDIALCLSALGEGLVGLGDNEKAIRYSERALKMFMNIYGQTTDHPHIARSLYNLGTAWGNLCDYRKSIMYLEQTLQMLKKVHGKNTPHLDHDIAAALSRLGLAWYGRGDHRKAISYHEQALRIMRSIHGQGTAHPSIAMSLNNIGVLWQELGDHSKAMSYFKQALQMQKSIYGQNAQNLNIVSLLCTLSISSYDLGDFRNAISYHKQALDMERSINGRTIAHPDVVQALNDLGRAGCKLGDYREAITYFERSLQMTRSIYGHNTPHPNTVTALRNLSDVLALQGDHRRAISLQLEALVMTRE